MLSCPTSTSGRHPTAPMTTPCARRMGAWPMASEQLEGPDPWLQRVVDVVAHAVRTCTARAGHVKASPVQYAVSNQRRSGHVKSSQVEVKARQGEARPVYQTNAGQVMSSRVKSIQVKSSHGKSWDGHVGHVGGQGTGSGLRAPLTAAHERAT